MNFLNDNSDAAEKSLVWLEIFIHYINKKVAYVHLNVNEILGNFTISVIMKHKE